jgi:hypothetical protein
MRRKPIYWAACLSIGASAFAFAQQAVPETTAPGSAATVAPKPADNAASPAPATRDQEPAAGAATTGGTGEPRITEPASGGSAANGPASAKGTDGTVRRDAKDTDSDARSSNDANASKHRKSETNRSHAIAWSDATHVGSKDRSNRRSRIAPELPSDENASADQFLHDAQTALRNHHIGEAQEALERAETRVLESTSSNASQSQRVAAIEHAREALGHKRYLRADMAQAGEMIDQALSQSATGSTAAVSGGSQSVP